VYGKKGSASTDNHPGGRGFATGWYDSTTQELWLFGGRGIYNSSITNGVLIFLFDFNTKITKI